MIVCDVASKKNIVTSFHCVYFILTDQTNLERFGQSFSSELTFYFSVQSMKLSELCCIYIDNSDVEIIRLGDLLQYAVLL